MKQLARPQSIYVQDFLAVTLLIGQGRAPANSWRCFISWGIALGNILTADQLRKKKKLAFSLCLYRTVNNKTVNDYFLDFSLRKEQKRTYGGVAQSQRVALLSVIKPQRYYINGQLMWAGHVKLLWLIYNIIIMMKILCFSKRVRK